MYKLICLAAGIILFHLQLHAQALKPVWSFTLKGELAGEPVRDKNHIYLRDEGGHVYCLNASNGKLRWKFHNGDSRGQSLVIHGSDLFFNSDAGLHSLNKETGALNWVFDAGTYVFAGTPGVAEGKVFTANQGKDIHVVDARTGKHLKTISSPEMGNAEFTVAGSQVLVFSDEGHLLTFNAKTLKKGWTSRVPEGPENGPLVIGNSVFAPSFSREAFCLNRETGKRIWQYKPEDEFQGCPSSLSEIPAVGQQIVCYTDGYGYALGADKKTGAEIWRVKLSEGIWEKAFLREDQFGVLTENRLYFLDQKTGAIRSEWQLPGKENGGYLLTENLLIYGTENKRVHCLELPDFQRSP